MVSVATPVLHTPITLHASPALRYLDAMLAFTTALAEGWKWRGQVRKEK